MARRYKTTLQYNPFTFQELWTPAAYSEQRHIAQLEKYEEYLKNTSDVLQYLDPDRDPKSYAAVKNMMSNVDNLARDLSLRGLNGNNNMNTILRLARDYGSNVKPIIQKIDSYRQAINDYKAKRLEDPSYETFADINSLSVDNIDNIKGFDMSGVSGAKLGEKIAVMASAIAKIKTSDPTIEKLSRDYDIIKTYTGFTEDEIKQVINGNDTQSALAIMVDQLKKSEGYYNLDESKRAKMDPFINNGLMSALRTTQTDIKESKDLDWAKYNLDAWYKQRSLALAAAELNYKLNGNAKSNKQPTPARTISNGVDLKALNNPYQKYTDLTNPELLALALKELKKEYALAGKDPKNITKEEITAAASQIKSYADNFGIISSVPVISVENGTMLKNINVLDSNKEYVGELDKKHLEKNPSSYDITIVIENNLPKLQVVERGTGKKSNTIPISQVFGEEVGLVITSGIIDYANAMKDHASLPENPVELAVYYNKYVQTLDTLKGYLNKMNK